MAFTHLHVDHVGWVWHPASGSDRPAFGHADHWVAEAEWAQRDDVLEASGAPKDEVVTALEPRVRTVTDGQEIPPGVEVRITAGHTPGHTEYVITFGRTAADRLRRCAPYAVAGGAPRVVLRL